VHRWIRLSYFVRVSYMRILSIETSCDETGIAIIESPTANLKKIDQAHTITVLADITHSQATLHAQYGGVFPNLARREHAKNIIPLIVHALTDAGMMRKKSKNKEIEKIKKEKLQKIFKKEPELYTNFLNTLLTIRTPKLDAIGVTAGPGLEPALWVGITTAHALGFLWGIPVIPINHMEGHIMIGQIRTKKQEIEKIKKEKFIIEPLSFPSLALLISGGHTELILIPKAGVYKILGQTRDDAVGEAFDKVARMLGLSYPGGPEISHLAETAPQLSTTNCPLSIILPRPMLKSDNLDFSFAGLKTAVLYTIKKIPEFTQEIKALIAKEFEDSVTEVLITKTCNAIEIYQPTTLILGGGVAANKKIRLVFQEIIKLKFPHIKLFLPDHKLTTDNGLMIGIATLFSKTKPKKKILAQGTLRLNRR